MTNELKYGKSMTPKAREVAETLLRDHPKGPNTEILRGMVDGVPAYWQAVSMQITKDEVYRARKRWVTVLSGITGDKVWVTKRHGKEGAK